MRLNSLRLTNFRGIEDLKLEFADKVNVLLGANGAGKTAILECAAIMLSRLIGRIRSTRGTGRFFTDYDVSSGSNETRNEVDITFDGASYEWSITKTRRGRRQQTKPKLKRIKDFVDLIHSRLEKDESSSLPVVVYYPVNRAVLDIPLRIKNSQRFDQLAAYDQALSGDRRDFRTFFAWFREHEDLENEQFRDSEQPSLSYMEGPSFGDRQLPAVRLAIERFLPGFTGLRVKRKPLRMVVRKHEEELIVNQLSDGEKCTLAMVGDLARRLAIANPALQDPLHGEGIVLIDEIDLHLHPKWQRQVVTGLRDTFPNCQFIVSTHSPQVVSHVKQDRIWLLKRGTPSTVSGSRPIGSYGQMAGRILEDLMDVPERPQEIKEQLSTLFWAIRDDDLSVAKDLSAKLHETIGDDPDLANAEAHIFRKEALESMKAQ